MRFALILFVFLTTNVTAQIGFGVGGYQNLYNRLKNPDSLEDTLYNSSGQLMGLIPGLSLQLHYNHQDKWGILISGEGNLRLWNVAIKHRPFQGIGSLSLSGNAKFYFIAGRPEKLDGAAIVGFGGGYQLNRTEFIYRPPDFRNYPRSFFPTWHGEISLGLGEIYVHRGVFFRLGFGSDGSNHLQLGIRYNINLGRYLKENRDK